MTNPRRRVAILLPWTVAFAITMAGAPTIAIADAAGEVTPAEAGQERPRPSLLTGWTFTVAPYLWLPAIEGRVGAGGVTARVDVSHGDVLDLIGDGLSLIAGFGRIEAMRGRFLAFVDLSLTRLDTDESATIDGVDLDRGSISPISVDTKLRMDIVFLESGLGYRLLESSLPGRASPLLVDILAGARYYYFWTQAKAKVNAKLTGLPSGPRILNAAGRVTTTTDWADPILGVRWSVPLLDDLTLGFRGDIGGFGAGSDLSWSLTGTLRYRLPWRPFGLRQSALVGYRVLAFDYESGDATLDLTMSGPAIGLVAQF